MFGLLIKSMNNLFSKIESYITQHKLINNNSKIVVGLSGGPDSVFLLNFLNNLAKQKQLTLLAAHLNHEWRADSTDDVKFCQDLCSSIGVPLISQKISNLVISLKFNGSKEEYARKCRRYFFEQLKKEHNADSIALAHHAQDQQETFFIRLIRGSALAGLTAMQPKQDGYIRPLLTINKKEILSYLKQNNISYLTDPTNSSDDFLRNRIRNHVLPALQKCDVRFDKSFSNTLYRLQETEKLLNTVTKKTFKQVAESTENGFILDIKKLFELEEPLQKNVLMQWLIEHNVNFYPTDKFLQEIVRFLQQPSSKNHALHHEWQLIKKKNLCSIKKAIHHQNQSHSSGVFIPIQDVTSF